MRRSFHSSAVSNAAAKMTAAEKLSFKLDRRNQLHHKRMQKIQQRRAKGLNLFEQVETMYSPITLDEPSIRPEPFHNGRGVQFFRMNWKNEQPCYWTVTRTKPRNPAKEIAGEYSKPKVWGKLTWNGVEEEREREIRGCFKRVWGYVPSSVPVFPAKKEE